MNDNTKPPVSDARFREAVSATASVNRSLQPNEWARSVWRDHELRQLDDQSSGATRYVASKFPFPCWGVGFTGSLSPGCLLLVAAWDHAHLLTWELASSFATDGINGRLVSIRNSEICVLRPGDTLAFKKEIERGVFVLPVINMGCDEPHGSIDSGATHLIRPFNITIAGPSIAPPDPGRARVVPVVRIYAQPDVIPSRVGHTPCPAWHVVQTTNTDEPSNSLADIDTKAVSIAPETLHVTIQLHDNDCTTENVLDRVVGGESGSYEVWWRLPNGSWCHNDADDFDAASGGGRGTVSPSHDVEVYDVPHNARAVYVRKVSGNDFWWTATLSAAWRASP